MIGALTISRDSRNTVRITIMDRASGTRFVELHMTPNDFAMALTGLSHVDGDLAVRGLDTVGKELVIEKRAIDCPLDTFDKKELTDWLVQNAQEDGWIVDTYLDSQNSVGRHNGRTILNYSVRKYIPALTAKPGAEGSP